MPIKIKWPAKDECSKGNYCEEGCANCSRATTTQQLVDIINHCIANSKTISKRFEELGVWHNYHDAVAVRDLAPRHGMPKGLYDHCV